MLNVFTSMLGAVMVEASGSAGDEELRFAAEDGRVFRFYHHQDCCESVCIEDVCGDLRDLVGSPIVEAEEASNEDAPKLFDEESYTWTFYRFATAKGSVTVRFLGRSNGYYAEGVEFEEVAPATLRSSELAT